jgi:hypothetical protein
LGVVDTHASKERETTLVFDRDRGRGFSQGMGNVDDGPDYGLVRAIVDHVGG